MFFCALLCLILAQDFFGPSSRLVQWGVLALFCPIIVYLLIVMTVMYVDAFVRICKALRDVAVWTIYRSASRPSRPGPGKPAQPAADLWDRWMDGI